MNSYLSLEHCGETLWLLPDKAIYWPARRTLLVADVHIGKAASYRALHQPVPRGTTDATLARLDALLNSYDCEQLIILGDFLHARTALSPGTLASLHTWRSRHSAVNVVLVRGNHDRHAGDPPVDLGIEVRDEPLLLEPFALQHEPMPHPSHPVLAGHVHPVYLLRGRARQRLRLPCFLIDAQVSLLPAFGEFTGGWLVEPGSDTRVFLAAGDQVWALAN